MSARAPYPFLFPAGCPEDKPQIVVDRVREVLADRPAGFSGSLFVAPLTVERIGRLAPWVQNHPPEQLDAFYLDGSPAKSAHDLLSKNGIGSHFVCVEGQPLVYALEVCV